MDLTESESTILGRVIAVILHNQATLHVLLGNQMLIFEEIGITPTEEAIDESFEKRRKQAVERLAGNFGGQEVELRTILRHLDIDPDSIDRDEGASGPIPPEVDHP